MTRTPISLGRNLFFFNCHENLWPQCFLSYDTFKPYFCLLSYVKLTIGNVFWHQQQIIHIEFLKTLKP